MMIYAQIEFSNNSSGLYRKDAKLAY